MKKIILATIALLFFSVPLYAQEDDEDNALYEKSRQQVDEALQQVKACSEVNKMRREHYTGGGNPFLTSLYNELTGNKDSDCQDVMALYKAALQNYQLELEIAKSEKEYRNVRR